MAFARPMSVSFTLPLLSSKRFSSQKDTLREGWGPRVSDHRDSISVWICLVINLHPPALAATPRTVKARVATHQWQGSMIHSEAMRFQLPHSAQLSVHDWARYMMLFISSLPHCIQMAAKCRPSLDILAAEFNNKSKDDCRPLRIARYTGRFKGAYESASSDKRSFQVSSACSPLRSAVPQVVAPQPSCSPALEPFSSEAPQASALVARLAAPTA